MKHISMYLFAAIYLISLDVSADEFHKIVSYFCDEKNNRLVVEYRGAYNEAGEELIAHKGDNAWNPADLRGWAPSDRRFSSPKTIRRNCKLSDTKYILEISPVPNDFRNVQGRCGDWETARVRILKHGKILVKTQLESDCYDTTTPVTTKIIVKTGQNRTEITRVSWDEFYSDVLEAQRNQ